MSFEVYGSASSNKSSEVKIDYDALNRYVVETCQLENGETLPGYISSIVDLGTQNLPDAEYVFDGDEEAEVDEIAKDERVYFKDGYDNEKKKPCRLKCVPQRPIQCVAISVDFPEIVLDKGQFFGNSSPKPLRLWLGGQYYLQGKGMVIARPTALKVVNLDKTKKTKQWSFSPLHVLYKLAVSAKLIKPGEAFLPNDIDKLLGTSHQFNVQIFMKKGKDGKEYFNENIKLVGALGRGQAAPEIVDPAILVQFNKKNSPEGLKMLRSHVINTIKQASNYGGSMLQKQLEEGKQEGEEQDEPVKEAPKQEKAKPAAKPKPAPVEDDFLDEDSLPF